ncbi:hypothetical protein FEM33_04605 [Dyadobacter flavalbus]|uniref:Uncharacterized protein n=1 Tax=Dyadobacter flavalbus TaxID=2579942 RepID=A0A5M8R2I5_9BACT|nr:hypothetical protein [Dyadobacter flavalbus]KAA6440953.1 hypothetical protein FEM33_04605 [Dyadobacter flavalbus]
MEYSLRIFLLLCLSCWNAAMAQDSTGLAGIPFQETVSTNGRNIPYLFKDWYSGMVRTSDDQVHDGLMLRYDLEKDEVEYKKGTSLFRIPAGITEFSIMTGSDLYTFKSGFPAVDGYTDKSFYRVLYDGNTKLLKKYTNPIHVEKASATREMDEGAKLYILKNEKLNPVKLNDKNSFLKLLPDEKNKLNYVIKEQQLEFGGDDDLITLLEEYDSYKAGRGGN